MKRWFKTFLIFKIEQMNPIASAILARGLGTGSTRTGKNRQMSQSLSLNRYSLTRSRQNGQSRSQSLFSLNQSRQSGQNRSQSLCSLNRSRQSGYPLNRRRGRVSTSLNTSNESEIRTTLFVGKSDAVYSISYHWFATAELFSAELVSGCVVP